MRLSVGLLFLCSGVLCHLHKASNRAEDLLTQQTLDNLKFYAQYSIAALCNSNAKEGVTLKCKGGCPAIENNNVTVVGSFKGLLLDLNGFVAVDHVRHEIVGALRATSTLRNLFADAILLKKDCPLVSGCKVHVGFADAWAEIAAIFQILLDRARAANPPYKVTFAGYSLGGATATLAAAHLRGAGYEGVDLYTYGSPRVGNDAFVNYVMNQKGNEYRVTHFEDLAPTYVPLFLGYRHTFPEFWLSEGPSTRTSYDLQEVQVCQGTTQRECNSAKYNLDFLSHLYYFQYTLRCLPISVRDDDPLQLLQLATNASFVERMQTWYTKDREVEARLGV